MTQCCIRSPASGGRFRNPSKYCEMHLFLEDQAAASTADTNLPTPHSPNPILEKDKVRSLPNNDSTDLLVGCRKSKGVTRFHDRTAGVLAIVRPCGVIVNTCEMYTCESPTQVYLFLVMTFARGRDIDRLHYLGYDRTCDLHPFLCNLSAKGAHFAKWLTRHVSFLVDAFHVAHHTEPCCMPPNNPECKYHPKLAKFDDIRGANTECAEQSFRWLNKLKFSMKNMHQYKFNFFLHVVVNERNAYRESQLKEMGLIT